MADAQTARAVSLEDRTTRVRSSLTYITMTTAVHDALEALLHLRAENGAITPANLADAVLTHDLDEVEAETLAHELENHGAAPEGAEQEVELARAVGSSLYTTDPFQMFLNEAGRYPLLTAAEE